MTKKQNSALSREDAKTLLRSEADRISRDPLTNSVFSLSQTLFRDLEAGKTQLNDLSSLANDVHLALMEDRADRFRDQHFGANAAAGWAPVTDTLTTLADQGFDAFKAAVERPNGGVVFTGHPTFALSKDLRTVLARHITKPTKATRKSLNTGIAEDGRRWAKTISLPGEHDEVQDAISNAVHAQQAYADTVLKAARKAFPDRWTELSPALPTLASWVGYDLDGRTDIHWSQSITFRLQEKAARLTWYAEQLTAIIEKMGDVAGLSKLHSRLGKVARATDKLADLFAEDLTDPAHLVPAANALTDGKAERLTNAQDITDVLTKAIRASSDTPGRAAALMTLRAVVDACQLGTARIHLRVNAAQVRTVINRDLGLETEDRVLGRLALAELASKAAKSTPRPVNFADLFLEQSTARRQFMMCAQILKHIDEGSTIRFLIAESENPATVMGALYLARQYGVDHQLDISPLFETPDALETGGRFIERLLEEPEFVAYAKTRGYLSIQLGFSDAGRFIGQVAADMAIERIHNLISRAIHQSGHKIDLLIFNTHGESMGRGAWPGTFEQRFDHALTPWTRFQARKRNLRLRHEVSFQGGDGFLHFGTPELAETTYAAFCQHLLSEPKDVSADPFYTRTDFVWDFYRSLRAWQQGIFVNEDYAALLSDFAGGFLVKAGSRVRRRSGGPKGPRSLRAISHNATLQQVGVPLNTAAGIGSSVRRENDRLVEITNTSARMRGLILLALKARVMTSVPALRAYAKLYDPTVWVALSRMADKEPETAAAYRSVYYALRQSGTRSSLERIANILSVDLGKFDRMIAQLDNAPSPAERHEGRLDLHILHAIRQAAMMRALSLVGRLPRISERHGTDARDLVNLVLQMQIGETVDALCQIFPKAREDEAPFANLAETGHESGGDPASGYDKLHSDIITPLDDIARLMHSLSLAIAHAYGAYG